MDSIDSLENLPLRCHVDHGVIHVEIGHNILAFAATQHPEFWQQSVEVVDAQMFGLEVLHKINEESEDGSTLLTRMLDQAILNAISDGAEGVTLKGD